MDTFVIVEIQFNSIIVLKASKIVKCHSQEGMVNGLDYRLKLCDESVGFNYSMFNHY